MRTMSSGSFPGSAVPSHSSLALPEGRLGHFELEERRQSVAERFDDIWTVPPVQVLPALSPAFNRVFEDLQICPTTTPAHSREVTDSRIHPQHHLALLKVQKPLSRLTTVTQSPALARYVHRSILAPKSSELFAAALYQKLNITHALCPTLRVLKPANLRLTAV